jgi:hypothetical protein
MPEILVTSFVAAQGRRVLELSAAMQTKLAKDERYDLIWKVSGPCRMQGLREIGPFRKVQGRRA